MCGGTWPPFHGEPQPGYNTRFVLDGTDNLIDAPPAKGLSLREIADTTRQASAPAPETIGHLAGQAAELSIRAEEACHQ
jgi:hypothetical protein